MTRQIIHNIASDSSRYFPTFSFKYLTKGLYKENPRFNFYGILRKINKKENNLCKIIYKLGTLKD